MIDIFILTIIISTISRNGVEVKIRIYECVKIRCAPNCKLGAADY